MPVTFLAHQAPVLAIARRWPARVDGVALVAGSVAPDLAYVSRGWGYGPAGIPLWFDGHRWSHLLIVAAGASLLSLVLRRVVLPVMPLALPHGRPFHLQDYRHLADVRPFWWVTVSSAAVGVVTHLLLDSLTHENGRTVAVLQYGGSVLLGAWATWQLYVAGRERRYRRRDVAAVELPVRAKALFSAIVGVAMVVATGYAQTRVSYGGVAEQRVASNRAVVVIAWCWVAFAGVVLACLVCQPLLRLRDPDSSSRAAQLASPS